VHGLCPKSRWRTVNHAWRLADLMAIHSWRFQGRSLNWEVRQSLPQTSAVWPAMTSRITSSLRYPGPHAEPHAEYKYPLPPISAIDPAARLIVFDNFALTGPLPGSSQLLEALLSGPLHDLSIPPGLISIPCSSAGSLLCAGS